MSERDKSERQAAMEAFLSAAGWGKADVTAVPGDASTRRYFRLTKNGEKAVLMDAPPGAETPGEPEGATVEDRRALGYNALARLAGPNPVAFAAIANELRIRGFSAPKILAADLQLGFLLLEDFGAGVYARAVGGDPSQEAPLYRAAVETLGEIYRSTFPAVMSYQSETWRVRAYDAAALLAEVDLLLDWYAPDQGADITAEARERWHAIWTDLFQHLGTHAPGLALRDFHAENLFWLPERESVTRVGLIDFQDALFAHPAYDLVSFLEDARRDVSPDLVDGLITAFCEAAKLKDDADFRRAYSVMGAQRNAKIMGIFVRLAARDGKPEYRQLIPRVRAHFVNNLKGSDFTELRKWFAANLPEIVS